MKLAAADPGRSAGGLTTRAAVACGCLLAANPATGQYLDNESIYSNQDTNTETRRSEHMRVCFGHYNRDTGMGGMSERLAQGNLQMYEQLWNRWVNEMGMHDINSKAGSPTPKYRSNFHFLMTWNDGGGGGAWSSGDPWGYGYAMANPGYCMFDPPSGATPHENGHAWEIDCGGFNGSDSSGAWWECTANWMQLQLLNSYPGPGNVIYNPMYYPAHGRDYYDTWTIWEAAKDDPRYGPAWVNSVWTNATTDQAQHEYILDRMIRLDASGSPDKAGGFKDLWGDMVKKFITWDYARHQWFISSNSSDDGSDWEFFRRCRTPLVTVPGMSGWYRPARAHWPMEFGFNLVPLTVSPGTTVTCNFQPVSDPIRQADWRACLVAVNNNGDAHYSTMWNAGTNSITLSADESKLYLTVAAVPMPMKVGANLGNSTIQDTWKMQLTDAGLLFPYAVSFTNASPRNVSYAKPTGVTWKSHTNPDSTVCNNIASGATVAATAYVSPTAMVLDSAQVLGNAKVMDYAVVRGSAQVRDTAEVSGYALVGDSAQIYGHAKVRDWGEVYNNCTVYDNGKVIEHGYLGDRGNMNVSGSSVVKGTAFMWTTSPSSEYSGCLISDGDTANGGSGDHGVHFGWNWGPDPTRFTNLTDNSWQYACYTFDDTLVSSNLYTGAFARDYYGVNHGLLMNGCRPAVDSGTGTRGGYVLPLNGTNQYVELPPGVNDFADLSVAVWVKWTGTAADQRIWSLGDGANKVIYLTPMDSVTGKLRVVIGNGTTTQFVDGLTALGSAWTHVVVTITGNTGSLYVNGTQVGQNTALTIDPDQLNAPLMQNANYLGRGNAGNYFQGSLDEFRSYMKSLTAAEVTTLFGIAAPAPVTATPDTTPPASPSWLVAPTLVTDDTVTMSATPGSDASGWIEYYFRCVSGGGHDSGWVSFNKYTDAGITPGATPTYAVKLRDRNGNTTAESSATAATGTPSSLGSAGFAYGPVGIADGQITMTATKAASASGKVEYKFDRVSPTTATSGWQSSPNYTQTGLTTGNSYSYTVTIRDNRGNTSAASGSASAVARDDAGPALCADFGQWVMQPYATIDNKVSMTAQTATDPSGVQYYFHCVSGGGPDSGWQDASTYVTPNALPDGSYVYQYKLRDKSARNNESAYSVSYTARITPTTGYHAATFAQLTSMPDDNLVTFNGVVLQANANHYVVKDTASTTTIMVKPDTYGEATDATKVLKLCQVKGHLWTYGSTRLVTYAAVNAIMDPPSFAVSGKVTETGSGAGIAGATVYISPVPGAAANAVLTTTTDSGGNYSKPVPNGVWYITVAAADHFPATEQTITVNGFALPNVNFTLDPAETITASVSGTGGTINPSGVNLLASGASRTFTITPFGGQSIASVLVDGVEQGSVTSYTFSNVTSNHTIAVTFVANTAIIPQSGSLLFSAINDDLPASGAIASWPTRVPGDGSLSIMGTPTVDSSGGQKWASNKAGGDGFHFGNYPMGNSIPMNGGTIVVVAKPGASMAANAYQCLVSVLLHQFEVCVDRNNLQIRLGWKNNGNDPNINTGVYLTAGQSVVLSYVVQPTGQITLYKNGVQVYANSATSDFTSISAGLWYGTDVNVGKGWNGDAWSSFNGNIGDVYVYQTALSATDRQTIEAGLSAKYGIAAPFTITASAGAGGTISPAGTTTVSNGGSATFVAMPNLGYAVTNLVVDGVSQGALASYTFPNVTASHTISVSFGSVPTYNLTATAGANGSITPAGTLSVNAGASQTFTITPNTGYQVSGVTVDGVAQGAITSYTFSNIQTAHTIAATFASQMFNITASAATGGTISPSGAASVSYGASQSYTITPNTNYAVSSVLVDGVDVGAVTSYSFNPVAANHTISAVFVPGLRNIPAADKLLFGADTKDLPASGAINTWATLVPSGSSLSKLGTPTVDLVGGQRWENNKADGDGMRFANYAQTTSIPINGATIVVAAKPGAAMSANSYQCLVSVFLSQFSINVDRNSFAVSLGHKGGAPWDFIGTGVTLAPGTPVVLTYVVQPTGELVLYKNGVAVYSNTAQAAFTSLTPPDWFGTDVSVGKGWNGDAWSSFNGDIGDVFVYKTALTDAQRARLEADVMGKFSIGGSGGSFTITASATTGGTISPSGALAAAPGSNKSFTVAPNIGYAIADVQIDGISMGVVSSYTFTGIAANHSIAATFVPVSASIALGRHAGTTNTTTYGDSLGFDVLVGGAPTPTGTVTLRDGGASGTVLGSGTLAAGTCTITPAATALAAGNHDNIVAVYGGDGNYSSMISTALDVQTVAQKPLTVTGAVANSKVYDGTTAASVTGNMILNGVVTGDTINLNNTTAGTFADKNVGTAKTVTTAMTISGGAAANYALTQPDLTADIAARTVTLTGSRPYDGTTMIAAANLAIANNIDGANLGLSGTATLAGKHAGVQAVIPGFATPARVQAATGTHNSTSGTTYTVNLAAPGAGNTLIAVVNTRAATGANAVTSIASTGATWARVGSQVVYGSSNGSTTEIWAAPGVPTGAGTAVTITIGSAVRSAAVVMEYSGILTTNPLDQTATSTGSSTAPRTGTTATTTQAAELWIGAIGSQGVSGGNTLTSPLNSFSIVTSAHTTSNTSSNNANITALALAVTSTGTAGTGGTITSTPWAGAVATFKAASSLVLTGSAAGNYTLTGSTGAATVTAAPVTVAAVNASKIYDGTTTAAGTPTITPALVGGDTTTALGQAFLTKHAGAGNKVIVPSIAISDGNGGNNYALTYQNFTAGTITPLPVTVAAVMASKTYDGTTLATGTPTVTPALATGDLATGLSQAFQTPDAGTGNKVIIPSITINDGNGGNNYALTLQDFTTGSISPASAAVDLTNLAQTYDGAPKPATATTTPTGLAVALTYDDSSAAPTNAGSYAVVGTITNPNYQGGASGTLVIAKAAATVNLTGLIQPYDGTPKAVTATTEPGGLTVNLTYDGSPVAPSAAGSYAVIATINDTNYQGGASGMLTITDRSYASWQQDHFTPEQIAAGLAAEDADPDGDGKPNLFEFAFHGDPLSGADSGAFATRLSDGPDADMLPELTFTCAVRRGAVFAPVDGKRQVSATIDGIVYTIEAASDLTGPWDAAVIDLGASDTAPAGSGLPDLTGTLWEYHTFSACNGLADRGFIRAAVSK